MEMAGFNAEAMQCGPDGGIDVKLFVKLFKMGRRQSCKARNVHAFPKCLQTERPPLKVEGRGVSRHDHRYFDIFAGPWDCWRLPIAGTSHFHVTTDYVWLASRSANAEKISIAFIQSILSCSMRMLFPHLCSRRL